MIISNLSVPFLPDTFDAARPQDTWSCCEAHRETANVLRWPLFLTWRSTPIYQHRLGYILSRTWTATARGAIT